MKKIALLGSTGSIGTQALEVIEKHKFEVTALTGNSNIGLLERQIRKYKPRFTAVNNAEAYKELKIRTADTGVKLLYGTDGLCEIASRPENDVVLNSVVGMVGLTPTLAAASAKKDIALANKETLVVGGELVTKAVKENGVRLLPVDSEHSAIFQCLQDTYSASALNKVILTASGGPFFGRTKKELENVTVEEALKHPNWSMGSKITVDSATLMNKGLEFIEAKWLFGVSPDQIDVVVHRESVIHSMVEFDDYSVLAQLGVPDMKIPIQYALTYPNRLPSDVKRLSLTDYGSLTFYKPDYETFSCLSACIKAVRLGGLCPAAVNGAGEKAVELFLKRKIKFLEIGILVNEALKAYEPQKDADVTLDSILEADRSVRKFVENLCSH